MEERYKRAAEEVQSARRSAHDPDGGSSAETFRNETEQLLLGRIVEELTAIRAVLGELTTVVEALADKR